MATVYGCSSCGWYGNEDEVAAVDDQGNFQSDADFDPGAAEAYCPACQAQVNELSF